MNNGIPYAIGLCCVWPLIVHFGILYVTRQVNRRDWANIQWKEIRWPWTRSEDK